MHIPPELRTLVFQSVKLLGVAIETVYGEKQFAQIEKLRLKMKSVRNKNPLVVKNALDSVYASLSKVKGQDLHKINKAFSMMLELINGCETAYRTDRLSHFSLDNNDRPDSLIFVFTSHPTEARSPEFLYLTDKVEDLLIRALQDGFSTIESDLLYFLKVSLRIPLANTKKPHVYDEAQQVLHTVLDDRILNEQINLKKQNIDVLFRTWVGGDKDGHPKVGPSTMMSTLQISRKKILSFLIKKIEETLSDIERFRLLDDLPISLRKLITQLSKLKKLANNDGRKIREIRGLFSKVTSMAKKHELFPQSLIDIEHMFDLYPALVLPLEIREDSSLIHEALLDSDMAIAQMLKALQKISKGGDPKWYVRGFIISMCQNDTDYMAAVKLIKKVMGGHKIPAIPLFENEQGLKNSISILESSFSKMSILKEHTKRWNRKFEVMLGYSDSSKENGVLPSRLMIESSLKTLEQYLIRLGMVPIFFHGSGGSTGRGGGPLKEQIAWWPKTALNNYKVTIQGETIQRHFHQPLILRSQVSKIVDEFSQFKKAPRIQNTSIDTFSNYIQESYRALLGSVDFQTMTTAATPYEFLNLLKIGSRPTKRSGSGKFNLRAIPWILCWTQTRLLLPIWWGTGSAWDKLQESEKRQLGKFYKSSPLMQSYVKNLGFTLARIELGVWKFHLNHSGLPKGTIHAWDKTIEKELRLTMIFFHQLTGEKNLTWYRPMLGESIYFRSSMIHPMNVIQKISLERKDDVLLRETVTGIACGMLTTG